METDGLRGSTDPLLTPRLTMYPGASRLWPEPFLSRAVLFSCFFLMMNVGCYSLSVAFVYVAMVIRGLLKLSMSMACLRRRNYGL